MGEFTVPVPVEIAWLADAVGEELTLTFIEAMAGRKITVPGRYIDGSNLAQAWGAPLARCLAEHRGGEQYIVPMLKAWRVRKLALQGYSNNDISSRVGVGRAYVFQVLRGVQNEVKRARAAAVDDRQLSLF